MTPYIAAPGLFDFGGSTSSDHLHPAAHSIVVILHRRHRHPSGCQHRHIDRRHNHRDAGSLACLFVDHPPPSAPLLTSEMDSYCYVCGKYVYLHGWLEHIWGRKHRRIIDMDRATVAVSRMFLD